MTIMFQILNNFFNKHDILIENSTKLLPHSLKKAPNNFLIAISFTKSDTAKIIKLIQIPIVITDHYSHQHWEYFVFITILN